MSEDIRKLQEWWYRHFTPEEYEFYGTYEAVPLLKEFKKFTFIDFDYFERGAAYICERVLNLFFCFLQKYLTFLLLKFSLF